MIVLLLLCILCALLGTWWPLVAAAVLWVLAILSDD